MKMTIDVDVQIETTVLFLCSLSAIIDCFTGWRTTIRGSVNTLYACDNTRNRKVLNLLLFFSKVTVAEVYAFYLLR